eukprot:15910279-Heterocapsa_arctica.AAC.1
MASPRPSASSLVLSAMGSKSASLFLPAGLASAAGPKVGGPAFGFRAPTAMPSGLGPVACGPAFP